jgi:hypothetical protein
MLVFFMFFVCFIRIIYAFVTTPWGMLLLPHLGVCCCYPTLGRGAARARKLVTNVSLWRQLGQVISL